MNLALFSIITFIIVVIGLVGLLQLASNRYERMETMAFSILLVLFGGFTSLLSYLGLDTFMYSPFEWVVFSGFALGISILIVGFVVGSYAFLKTEEEASEQKSAVKN